MNRWVLRVSAAGAVTLVAGALLAPAASAHVTVSSPDAAAGEYGKLVFRVPTESDDADTTGLTLRLPADTPFGSVSAKPKPGWTVTTKEAKLPEPVAVGDLTLTKAVRTVTWRADRGHGVAPREFDEFELSVGPFPDGAGTLVVPVVQRYSDGSEVDWDDAQQKGEPEPEHPAPSLRLATPDTAAAGAHEVAQDPSGADTPARVLGGVAVAVSLVTLGLVVAGRVSRRRSS